MSENPIDTEEQVQHELEAVELTRHPLVRAAYEEVAARWLGEAAPSAEMRRCFDAAFEEVMFSAAVWSMNQDPQHPRTITITRLEHEAEGVRIPGSRWGIDNPDSVYRVIPISGDERYVLRGRVAEPRLVENYFTLWDAEMNTVDVLSGGELDLDPGGHFEIEVDSDPRGRRRNHIRSAPGAREFYVRDVLLDWSTDAPNQLVVEKRGAARTPVRALDERAELAAEYMARFAANTLRWNQGWMTKPANELAFSIDRDTDGALRNQIYLLGHYAVTDEEALVIDVSLGGAKYFVAPTSNIWGTTNDIVNRTSSLNLAQATANEDGSLTFVLALSDPGVHNWLDPCGLHEGTLTLRWAEFPGGRPGPDVAASSRIVPLADLADHLPASTRLLDEAGRRAQLAARRDGYLRRLPGRRR